MRKIASGLLLGAMLMRASAVHAADPELERARALFEEAGELERHGQWASAQQKLREALKLRETPQLHYALGWALENEDKLLEAKTEYEAAVRLGQNRSGGEEPTRLATARLNDIEKKMPIIKVRVSGGAKSTARVVIDGKEIRRDDDVATTQVNPGSHVVRVERPGTEESIEQMAYVGRGTVRSIDVDTGEVVASGDTTQDRHTAQPLRMTEATTTTGMGSNDKLLPWILVGSGAAAITGGIALLVASSSDASDRDEAQSRWCVATACTGTRATLAESSEAVAYRKQASDAAAAGNTKQMIGFAVGGLGLAAAALGAYFFVKTGETSTTSASATPLPGGGYASASFAF